MLRGTSQSVAWAVPYSAIFVCVLLMVAALPAAAQTAPANPYRPNPADEDWTFLKTAAKTDVWDPAKYIPLGRDDWSLSLSGEIRFRPEGFRVRETARRDGYLLQRYLFGSELRMGRRFRVFAELQSGIINGQLRSPRPTDRNTADLHQLFVELNRESRRVVLAVGRQEIEIGSSRLISASPGLNVKRSFDGAAVSYRAASWSVAGVVAALVGVGDGSFDDRPEHGRYFWGVAAARRAVPEGREVGGYYLGASSDQSVYAQGEGSEVRHTIGLKWAGASTRVDLNYDLVFQWGHFNDAPVRAWAFATETGYRFTGARWRPRLGVRTDMASGDNDPHIATLQSFNPLFPGNAYSGAVGLFGPTNLTDLTPAFSVSPRRNLTLGFEAPSYWRTFTGDGVYSTDQRVLFGPAAGVGRYVGTNPGIVAGWQATRHVLFQGAITRFLPGGFLDTTFVKGGFGFYSVTARYRF